MLLSRKIHTFSKCIGKNILCGEKNRELFKYFHKSPNLAAQVSFKLSDIGEGIREVVIKEWFVQEGDKISQFDEICEVQSDKASVTITSRYDGIIKRLHYKIDETAQVGKPLVDIETEDAEEAAEEATENPPEVQENAPVEQQKPETKTEEPLCIPSVRRLAQEYNVELAKIKPRGKNGRILKEDVLNFLHINSDQDLHHLSEPHHEEDRTEAIKGFQRTMVKTMTESLKIPHLIYSDEIAVSKLSHIRKNLSDHIKLSFMPFFIKAASNALTRFPLLNATVDDKCEFITYRHEHNIGVAIDTKAGLAVPVIKNVEKLTIVEINEELQRLIGCGKTGTFSTKDLAGGTFTISNVGAIGGTYMKPIIMPPQVALIAFGAAQLLPRFDEKNSVVAEEIINISGAADHRVVDGATMARFTQLLKRQIENPYLLFLNL